MTSLAEQLRRLAVTGAGAIRDESKRASLLFDPRKAATLDRDTYYALGINGLEELSLFDSTLHAEFYDEFFSETAKNTERTMQLQEENKKLDQCIQTFLLRLSPYILLRPTQKILEWLIFRFRIHSFNVDAIFRSFLPYHETNVFVRMVQLLDISHPTNKWCWIAPIQKPGVPLAKGTIATHCNKDSSFLYFVCDTVPKAIKAHASLPDPSGNLRTFFNFYTSMVLSCIKSNDSMSDEFLAQIIPFLVKGFKSKLIDYKCSSYMIIGLLANKTILKEEVVNSLLKSMCKNISAKSLSEILTVVMVVCQTQQDLKALPEICFQELSRVPDLLDLLKSSHDTKQVESFLKLFLQQLVSAAYDCSDLPENEEDNSDGNDNMIDDVKFDQMLLTIAEEFKLSLPLQTLLVRLLVEGFLKKNSKIASGCTKVIQMVQRKYPNAFDSIISDIFSKKNISTVQSLDQQRMNNFISISMESARHQMNPNDYTSMMLSLSHPEYSVRLSALQHLESNFSCHPSLTKSDFVRGSIKHRLTCDENTAVLVKAMKLVYSYRDILFYDNDEAFDILVKLVYKNRDDPQWKDVAVSAFTLLLSDSFATASNETKLKIVVIVYDAVLDDILSDSELSWYNVTIRSSYFAENHILLSSLDGAIDLDSFSCAVTKNLKNSDDPVSTFKALYEAAQSLIDVTADDVIPGKPHVPALFLIIKIGLQLQRGKIASDSIQMAAVLRMMLEDIVNDLMEALKSLELGSFSGTLNTEFSFEQSLGNSVKLIQKNHPGSCIARMTSCEVIFSVIQNYFECLKTQIKPLISEKNTMKFFWDSCKKTDDPINDVASMDLWKAMRHTVFLMLLKMNELFQKTSDTDKSSAWKIANVKKTLQLFFVELFPCPVSVLHFLAPYWTASLPGYEFDPIALSAVVQTLHLGNSMLQNMSSKKSTNVMMSSSVTISLMLALSCKKRILRSAALNCLASCSVFSRNPLKELINHLNDHREEMEADAKAVTDAVAVFFSNDSTVKRISLKTEHSHSGILSSMIEHNLCCSATPMWMRTALLRDCFKKVNSRSFMLALLPTWNEFLISTTECSANSEQSQEMTEKITVNEDSTIRQRMQSRCEVSFMIETLTKIEPEFLTDEKIYAVFVKALLCDKQMVPQSGNCTSLQLVALGMMNKTFYSNLPTPEIQAELLNCIFDIGMEPKSSDTMLAISKTFKLISVRATHVVTELNKILELRKNKAPTSFLEAKRARIQHKQKADRAKTDEGDDELRPTSLKWKRTILILEMLQQKKKIKNIQVLFSPLFDIVEFVLENTNSQTDMDESILEIWEYVKQLVLTMLLNLFQRLKLDKNQKPKGKMISEQCKVELLVHCVRSSSNVQTQQHALLLLSEVASIFPEKVLHNVMAIFTFMGSYMLRQDNAYSFQIISMTIKTIIPALMNSKLKEKNNNQILASVDDTVMKILHVFVDSLPHIPAHRRITVFEELLKTVGAEQYLWMILALLVDQYTCKHFVGQIPEDDSEEEDTVVHASDTVSPLFASLEIWSKICRLVASSTQTECFIRYMDYLTALPDNAEEAKRGRAKLSRQPHFGQTENIICVIDTWLRSTNQLRRFYLTSLMFLSHHLDAHKAEFEIKINAKLESSDKEIMEISDEQAENAAKMTVLFQRLLESVLKLIQKSDERSKSGASKSTDDKSKKFWKVLLRKAYDVMHKINLLLPVHTFFLIIGGLLKNKLISTRKKAVELFAERISQMGSDFKSQEVSLVLNLSSNMMDIAETSSDSSSEMQNMEQLRYSCLLSLKLVIRNCGKQNPDAFVSILISLARLVSDTDSENVQVLSAAIMCLAELCTCLKAYCISHLNSFVPRLVSLTCTTRSLRNESLLFSCVTCIHRLLENLPNFISPYLDNILSKVVALSLLKKYNTEQEILSEMANSTNISVQIATRIRVIVSILATKIPSRVVVPALQKLCRKTEEKRPIGIRCMAHITLKHVSSLSKEAISQNGPGLTTLFMKFLEFRTNMNDKLSLSEIDDVEDEVIEAVIAMMLKLSEPLFRPIFIKLYDWACLPDNPPERLITYYKLMFKLAEKMKGLFSLFAGHLMKNIAKLLKKNYEKNEAGNIFPEENEDIGYMKMHSLRLYVCDCLHSIMRHDSTGFITKQQFELIMQPLVDQMDILSVVPGHKGGHAELDDAYVKDHVIPCLGQLAASVTDDICWKPFNYQILLKSRHDSPKVRFASLEALQAVAEKLSEDYTVMLPESIPFLAELMEDDEEFVEKKCHSVLRRLETVLGEPLQKYF